MVSSTHSKKIDNKNLFKFTEKKEHPKKAEKPRLEDFPVIKPGIGEKILCVQRRHPIVLMSSILLQFFVLISLLFLFIFISRFLPAALIPSWIVAIYIALAVISISLVTLLFTFMTWYYQFYIITNRSILHRYCFRIAGPYSEIVYGNKMHIREILRTPPNLLYDFLKIEDVHVLFHKQEQEEPFVFKTPNNAQVIEDLLHDLTIVEQQKTPYD